MQKQAEKLQDKPRQEAEVYEGTRGTEDTEDDLTGSDALYVRSTGACMGSKLSEQSLISFQLMPYEIDEGGGVSGGITSSISSEAVVSMNNNEKRASKEANNEKSTSKVDSYQIYNNEERQDDGDIADARLEVCSLFSEQAVATMNEFLVACNKALQGSRDEKEAALANGVEGVGEVAFSLQDLLASDLSPTLQARFGANTLLAMAPTFLANST